jgi:hypothetical protein
VEEAWVMMALVRRSKTVMRGDDFIWGLTPLRYK